MFNLFLSYLILFILAVLIGAAAGYALRAMTSRGPRRDVEEEIQRLSDAMRQARQRSEPTV